MCLTHLSPGWAAACGATVPVMNRRNSVSFSLAGARSYASSTDRSAPSG